MTQNKPQKIKLVKLLDLLQRETDEQHPISRQALCKRLNKMGISSNPRVLSLDIELLNESGFEIMENQVGREKFYYVEDRQFSIPELKVMIDAIEAASFISEKRTAEIVDKIASLGGIHRADLLKQNMVYFNTRKHKNSIVLFSIDHLEDAICRKKKVTFNYFDLDNNGNRVFRADDTGEKKQYCVDPVALVFNEDNYYLIAYSSHHPGQTANYRIDRMMQVEVVEDSEMSPEAISKIDSVGKYTEEAFKMYSGESVSVTLEFDKTLIGPVFDKFGEETIIRQRTSDSFVANVKVQVSPTFFGWLAQFGERMRIASPKTVIKDYIEYLKLSIAKHEQNCNSQIREEKSNDRYML